MSEDLTKKAAEILLKGGTLLSEHCPYCKGVRVMKDGHALCISRRWNSYNAKSLLNKINQGRNEN